MNILVFPPVALVPFHSVDILSARSRAAALSPLRGGRVAAVANPRACKQDLRERRRAGIWGILTQTWSWMVVKVQEQFRA